MLSTRKIRTMSRWGLICVVGVLTIGVCGCGSKPEYGDKKEDWAKTKPPPNWRGPGQPGGPPVKAMAGPASQPPPAAVNPGMTR
jgi:hypothetical protein